MAATGKITLKVKSGPGVLIGETEKTIENDSVDFSGLQFDQAGDYVISVFPTSPDVDPTEFRIKVLPEPEIVPQEESRGQEKQEDISGTRPIIAQIDRPTVELPPIEYERPANLDDTALVAGSIGMTPFVNYMGSPINDRDIQMLKLYHDGIVPKMSIMFYDSLNFMKEVGMPQDDTKIELFLNARSPNLKSIHLKFKIESFKDIGENLYSIVGTLDISELYRVKYKSYTGTSFEVLRTVCRELKLGFNSNIQNTDDSMQWRWNGSKLYEFMEHVVAHSYASDNSFMIGYIDYYYCFNYVDIEKEMGRDNSSDVGIETGNVENRDADSEKLTRVILINDKSYSKSCFYFDSDKKLTNNSTNLSLEKGYRRKTKYYDKEKKAFLVFDVDSTTSDESKTIILKGARGDAEAFENNYTTKYMGKIDTENVHKNYNYSYIQNRINLDELNKIELKVRLPNPNYNLYRFQKVQVQVINLAPTPTDEATVEWRLSGDWSISEINFNFANGMISQEIKLTRKELGKTPGEMNENLVKENKKEAKQQNENPAPAPARPNAVYEVGEIYTVRDKNGKTFTLTIKSLSDNGKEVVANIKET